MYLLVTINTVETPVGSVKPVTLATVATDSPVSGEDNAVFAMTANLIGDVFVTEYRDIPAQAAARS